MLDERFFSRISELSVPEMGTDNVAPLLYWLIRTVRPQRVLEVGMGYTTPFLAKALADNVQAIAEERELFAMRPDQIPLAYSNYYEQPYSPRLICVDRMNDPTSSAVRVAAILNELDLAEVCSVIEGDVHESQAEVRSALGTIDFAWIDTWDTLSFVRDYWSCIDPAGGMLAVHWLMTYPQGRAVLQYIQSMRGIDGGRLEMLNLREPHKVAQNSLSLVRRVRDYQDPEDLRPTGTARDPESTLLTRNPQSWSRRPET